MKLWNGLKSLIIPTECVICALPNVVICNSCRYQLLHSPQTRPVLLSTSAAHPHIASHLPFTDVMSRIVLGAKDDGNVEFERILIDSLLQTRTLFSSRVILVPVPSTARARRTRGRDFMVDICRAIAKRSGDAVIPLLTISRRISPQKSLNASDRSENLRGAFTVCKDLASTARPLQGDHDLLLVDDVLTTGATMREGFRALAAGGARCVGGISAAYSLNWRQGRSAH